MQKLSRSFIKLSTKLKIYKTSRILTSRPHIAGNDIDEVDLVKYVADIWRNSGLTVEIYPYEVLLSYPNEADSNYVSMVNENGELLDLHHA